MDATQRIARRFFGMRKDDATCAKRGADDPGADNSISHRSGGLIPGAANDGNSCHQAQRAGSPGVQVPRHVGRFMHAWKQRCINLKQTEQLAGPLAARDIQQQHTAGV